MIYRDFHGKKLSALGFGAMRLPVIDGNDANIDEAAALEMVDYAYQHGINYYDTAWGYHGENSELVMGKALKRYPRESFYVATKFPGYDPTNWPKVKEIFERQLEKLQVEYFDFYLFHNVCEMNVDAYLDDEKYGIYTYLMEQKKNGRIKHLGFSAHGSIETMKRFLEKYGENMEFCQIQLNYLDYDFQDAKGKMELLREYHIPVWVMEPLRGGRLCKLTDEEMAVLQKERPEASATDWAFRFLQTLPEVTVTLSGMSNMQQLMDNISIFEEEKPLSEKEMTALSEVTKMMLEKKTLPCTACHYCVSHCPMELDIPELIALYNEHAFTGGGFIAPMLLGMYPEEKKPSACIGCRSCETVCPQNIKISEMMSDFAERLKG
jgi:predicted aldo/keto reductase-like oxidoreductase